MTLRGSDAVKLLTCDKRIQQIVLDVATRWNIRVIEGHRNQADQDAAFARGASKHKWPFGKHNSNPSRAIDMIPLELAGNRKSIDWKDVKRICYFAGQVMETARRMGIKLRWGGDWDSDTELKDNVFDDLVHFEIVE